jgi:HAD superfamily hydrolase (TIGR01450 family)
VNRLSAIKHLALDLDGTLYLGKKLFPFTLEFLARIKRLGLGRTFFTNNSSTSTRGYVEKLRALGIDADADDIFSSTSATLGYLKLAHPTLKKLFVLGTPALQEEFAEHGYAIGEEPYAVIVGFDTTLQYANVCRAAWWIAQGKPFIATHCDAVCPTDLPTILPDCGAICAMLTHATGRKPDAVLGKPSPAMLEGVIHRHHVAPHEIAVVGDRLYTDVAMAQAAGAVSVLVLSGETTRNQADAAERKPDFVVENVGQLGEMLSKVKDV